VQRLQLVRRGGLALVHVLLPVVRSSAVQVLLLVTGMLLVWLSSAVQMLLRMLLLVTGMLLVWLSCTVQVLLRTGMLLVRLGGAVRLLQVQCVLCMLRLLLLLLLKLVLRRWVGTGAAGVIAGMVAAWTAGGR
jgi:hypothetical protein